ncbi:hypothetical protein TSUD_235010 [Trifolium subterraneum]|uniref:Uncharacterized protein n=1 Tax=Trifolium subterraneum TaxID=3900 RepID=A0A2Z6MUR8_TRISU|nr:hypothetical protein TSUD_235010 [Trifolium subterraneum]
MRQGNIPYLLLKVDNKMVNLETWKIWNEAVLGAVIDGRMQTVTSLTEVLFDICKMEEAHVAGASCCCGFRDLEEQKQLDMECRKGPRKGDS